MFKRLTYLCLSLYLLLTSLIAVVPQLIVPSKVMAGLAFLAGLGFFISTFACCKKPNKCN